MHHALPVQFVYSRSEFKQAVFQHGLIVADFSTSPAHLLHAAEKTGSVLQATLNTSFISVGISFSHLTSGLPFDFSLQPGLVRLQTASDAGRRIQEESWEPLEDLLVDDGDMTREPFRQRGMHSRNRKYLLVKRRTRRRSSRSHVGGFVRDISSWHNQTDEYAASVNTELFVTPVPRRSIGSSDERADKRSATVAGRQHPTTSWPRIPRHGQIRFVNVAELNLSATSVHTPQPLGEVDNGNGGDDFTFIFAKADRLYR